MAPIQRGEVEPKDFLVSTREEIEALWNAAVAEEEEEEEEGEVM